MLLFLYVLRLLPLLLVYMCTRKRCTLIVLAEWKPVESVATYDNARGVSLITASQRRNPPSCLDSKIHHNNLLNNILPKIQANLAGCADAIMLVGCSHENKIYSTVGAIIVVVDAFGNSGSLMVDRIILRSRVRFLLFSFIPRHFPCLPYYYYHHY